MDCNSCKERKVESVPYIVHEASMARNERTIKRLVWAVIIAVALIFLSNCAWLYVWQLYDYSSEEIQVDAQDGIANYIGNDGRIIFGATDSEE